jgi:hypothetical protein
VACFRRGKRESVLLLTNPALPAFFRAVTAVVAVLAGVTGIRTGAGYGKQIERDLVDEKN